MPEEEIDFIVNDFNLMKEELTLQKIVNDEV